LREGHDEVHEDEGEERPEAIPDRKVDHGRVAVKKKRFMTSLEIRIEYLANHPELVDELARLSWKEWQEVYQQRDETLEDSLKNYRGRMNIDRLPLTLVAVRAGRAENSGSESELIGMVSLKFHDMDTRPDLDPWLGGLLVLPEWRNRGVGTMLMHRATEEARRLNVPRLFLWTASAEGLYLKLGWRTIERTDYCGLRIVIMQKETKERSTD
jgi:GNAT superfamily N-acetyltransferase